MNRSFDSAAANYDSDFTHATIGKLQRKFVYRHLSKILAENQFKSILEINCGTGEDAIWLAQKGFYVTASDISEKMIAIASAKNNIKNLNFKQLDINDMSNTFIKEKFDLIFSNFGGLNCLSEIQLELFFKNASQTLTEKGKLVLIIMPKNSLWEQVYFLMKGKFNSAFRRKKKSAIANVDGEKVITYYYNPKETITLADHYFKFKQQNPIGFFIPPSYLEPFFKNKPNLIFFVTALERKITTRSFLAKYADHYLIAFEKK